MTILFQMLSVLPFVGYYTLGWKIWEKFSGAWAWARRRNGHAEHLQSGHYMPAAGHSQGVDYSQHLFSTSLCPSSSPLTSDLSFWLELGLVFKNRSAESSFVQLATVRVQAGNDGVGGVVLSGPADIWPFWVKFADPWNQLHQRGHSNSSSSSPFYAPSPPPCLPSLARLQPLSASSRWRAGALFTVS